MPVSQSEDTQLSISEMEQQFYQGYPEWRKNDYKVQKEILDTIVTDEQWKQYEKSNTVSISFND